MPWSTAAGALGNGLVMPAGPLRAPLPFQLELTDAIVVNGAEADAPVAEWLRHRFAGSVLRSSLVPAESADWLKGARVVAWAGIGAPERFFAMLRALGAEVAETLAFRDHQWLGEDDAATASGAGAAACGHAGHDRQGHGPAHRRQRLRAPSLLPPRACFT